MDEQGYKERIKELEATLTQRDERIKELEQLLATREKRIEERERHHFSHGERRPLAADERHLSWRELAEGPLPYKKGR